MERGFDTLADLIRETNQGVAGLGTRLDETNSRLDETNARLGKLESRFDNLLDFAGRETRELRDRVGSLENRVDHLEGRPSTG